MREIILDTETTGFDPASGDRLVEIGCIELVNRLPTGTVYHQYVNPERDMPEGAFKVHGLSEEFLSDKPLFEAICDGFLEFIAGAVIVAHNAPFDMKFLNAELARVGRPQFPEEQSIDTLAIAKKKYPSGNSLNGLCRRFDIDLSNRELHGALIDADLLAQVYLELNGGRQPGLVLEAAKETVNVAEMGNGAGAQRKERPEPLKSRLTPDEVKAHALFIEAALGKDPVWLKA